MTKTISQVIEPPPPELIASSINELRWLGALNKDECLTPLGYHLSQLPVGNVRIGTSLIVYLFIVYMMIVYIDCLIVYINIDIFI